MTDQPPGQPPPQPPRQPVQGNPETQPIPAAGSASTGTPPSPPRTNVWRQATSTRRGRIGLAAGAGALALLILLGFGLASLVALRLHDRVSLAGGQGDRFSRGDDRRENDDRPRFRDRDERGLGDGRARDPGGLGRGLLGGAALHGNVTATVDGSVQALVFQRGEVTAVSATSISLKSSDGFVGTYGRTAATTSRGADPVKGAQAFVLARASDKVAVTIRSTRL